eukprot:4424332-Pyramimonas_sp.AAC.1
MVLAQGSSLSAPSRRVVGGLTGESDQVEYRGPGQITLQVRSSANETDAPAAQANFSRRRR